MKYIAELEKGVWIAPWSGDPGRTLKKENAKIFNLKSTSWRAIELAQKIRPFKKAKVIKVCRDNWHATTDDGCSSIWEKTLKYPRGGIRNAQNTADNSFIPVLDILETRLDAGCQIEKCDMGWCLFDTDGECVCYGTKIRQMLVNLIFTDC